MIFKSIRWRLQIWYGLILVAVLAGFGVTAYQLERGRQLAHVDDELHRRLNILMNVLNPPPRGPGPEEPPFDAPENGPGGPPEEGRRPFPPRRERPPMRLSERFRENRELFQLPARIAGLFDESDMNGFYYVTWSQDGKELMRSTNAPSGISFEQPKPRMDQPDPLVPRIQRLDLRESGPRPPEPARMRGKFREVSIVGRGNGQTLLVGRSIQRELTELKRTAWILSLTGTAILLLGLAGGFWLATRAIRPIAGISATALKIAAGELSQRINVAETESELGQLASVLNSTFTRLDAAFTQQQQFTSDAAHELRTPVSVMLTQTQTSLNRERSAAEYRETIEACQRSAQRMRRLLESLLQLARLDAGQEAMKRNAFDLARTVADCVELVRPLAADRNITVQTDLVSAECVGDSDRLAQVITNLLTNAVHYNSEGGKVWVSTRRDGDFAVAEVADNGPGIASEHLPHVFDRFYRVDSARTSSQGRSGLGLAISKAIVDAHGGSIEVSSEERKGTTFAVRLPWA